MKCSLKLKHPNADEPTLILLTSNFAKEGRRFVYSTGETIHPSQWDKGSKLPKMSGKEKSKKAESIRSQLNRYVDLFHSIESRCKQIGEPFTSELLKKEFDLEFKKGTAAKTFFDVYDEFLDTKTKLKEWGASTKQRYVRMKDMLKDFQTVKKYRLSFGSVNEKFLAEFTTYCLDDLDHYNNTFDRDMGLLKTFLHWATKNKYNHNRDFTDFKKVGRTHTKQIALTIDDLNAIMAFYIDNERLERVRDVFVFSCVTGMRFGELSLIKKSNVTDTTIELKEQKESGKPTREIPLTALSKFILTKYDYKLPLIANQKHNVYIKELFKKLGYDRITEKQTVKGKDTLREEMPLYERITSHTARRTFITMMKRQGKSDKLIASITGHLDMKTLNQYYQVDTDEKKEAMDAVFDVKIPLKKVL